VSIEKHAEFIGICATEYAKAKSNRIGNELKLKVAKAMLMQQAQAKGVMQMSAQERDALADPEYVALIDELVKNIEVEETLKYQIESSKLQIDVWRTREASERLAIRSNE
jgi:hypothetical protein